MFCYLRKQPQRFLTIHFRCPLRTFLSIQSKVTVSAISAVSAAKVACGLRVANGHGGCRRFDVLVLVKLLLVAFPIFGRDAPVKLLALMRYLLPLRGNDPRELGERNLAVRLAMATFLGAIAGPVRGQKLRALRICDFQVTPMQQSLALVVKEEVVGRQGAERLMTLWLGGQCFIDELNASARSVAMMDMRRVCDPWARD